MRKTPMSRLISWILVIVCIFSLIVLPVCAEEKSLTDVLTEAKQGVVQIYGLGYDRYNNPESSWIGSGFCVGNAKNGNGIFVTNWHVATGDGEYDADHVRLWILKENCGIRDSDYQPDPSKSIECTTLSTTYGHPDYAIIETNMPVTDYKALPLLSSKEIATGETVYALGYPGSVTEHSITSSVTVTNGIISQHMQDAYADETWVLMHTALISGGNSGGPLITAQGAVVGVNTYLFDDDRYCAVYIDYIMDALDKGSIPYQVYGETPDVGETTGPGETTEPGPGPVGKSSNKLLSAAGILLIVLAAAVIAVIKIPKKSVSGKANHKKNPDPGPTTPVYPTFKLKMPDGRIVPVYDKPMLIGRDPSCDILIPSEYTSIGRKHCRLEILQGRLILTDLESRNGTFIHGKQIPQNTRVALKNGSSFAIGQSDYVITVI